MFLKYKVLAGRFYSYEELGDKGQGRERLKEISGRYHKIM